MNNSLNLEQCKEYVRNIKDLEVSCYQQERLLQTLRNQIPNTKNRIYELEQKLIKEKKPTEPLSPTASVVMSFVGAIVLALFGAGIGAVVGIALRIIVAVFSAKVNLFLSPWLPYICWGAGIGYGIAFLCLLYWFRDSKGEAVSERKDYPRKVEEYNRKQTEIKNLIECKKKNMSVDIPQEITKCEKHYAETKELLQKYYGLGFIYPKYRGLVPICTIYEYLESGRCFTLIGPHGAYNLYDHELMMQIIVGKLDAVIDRLDDINDAQRMLAREIRTSNIQLNNISRTLDNIENNTALTQYYSSVTASNTSFMSWLAARTYDMEKAKNRDF